MRTCLAVLVLLVASLSESTSDIEISSNDLDADLSDLESDLSDLESDLSNLDAELRDLEDSPDDLEVDLGDPTSAQETRRHRAASADSEDKLQPKHVLPINKQVSAFLPGRRYKRFLYRQSRDGVAISLVVTPCSASLVGDITFQPDNARESGRREVLREVRGPDQVIYSARRGLTGSYSVNITATADTYVHFLATDEDLAGLGSLRTTVGVRSRSKSRAEISWAPGSHGGQALTYCLITSPTRHFSSVCGGLSAKFGQQPPDRVERRRRRQQMAAPWRRRVAQRNSNITVGCVGKSTVYTLHDLMPGQQYYVTVFGQYANRSVSFQYGTTEFRYRDRSDLTWRKIRKNRVVHLELSPTRPYRKLEMRGMKGDRLYYYGVPCGGPVDVRVTNNTTEIHQFDNRKNGELFQGDFNVSSKTPDRDSYFFHITATEGATDVEFQASFRRGRLGLATLPARPRVRVAGRRRRARLGLNCTQLALRMPRAGGRRLEYCVLLELDTTGRTGRRFQEPSVCGLELRERVHPRNMTRCGSSKELRRGKRIEVIFDGLTPGQTYVVRAMVRPEKGRFIPYHLRQVTLPACSNELLNELPEHSVGGREPISGQGSDGERRKQQQPDVAEEARAEAAEETNNELSE